MCRRVLLKKTRRFICISNEDGSRSLFFFFTALLVIEWFAINLDKLVVEESFQRVAVSGGRLGVCDVSVAVQRVDDRLQNVVELEFEPESSWAADQASPHYSRRCRFRVPAVVNRIVNEGAGGVGREWRPCRNAGS